jgi:predicted RNA-binding protein with PIN domain
MRIIIDAYNVIRTNPESKRIEDQQGNLQARSWLVNMCKDAVRNGEEWVLVFDGAGAAAAEQTNAGNLVVRYSAPRTADEVIRELGEDARALKIPARIISSDSEVQVSGCEQQDSASFLEFLKKRKAKGERPKAPSKKDIAEKILKTLADKKHAAAGNISNNLKDGLIELISYLYARELTAQKMAREIEKYLRERIPVQPTPDLQKEVFRTIRQSLESFSS